MSAEGPLNDKEFSKLIRVAPLVAIDLVLRDDEKNILLSLRRREPAKGYYFVPGGRIFKNETIRSAFERIAKAEIGSAIVFDDARLIGVYDHIYPNNRYEELGYGTHYVVAAYEVLLNRKIAVELDADNAASQWVSEIDLLKRSEVHDFVKAYFR